MHAIRLGACSAPDNERAEALAHRSGIGFNGRQHARAHPGDRGCAVAHVTFIHGIANKPPADVLLEQWRIALLDNDGVDLEARGVTSSMVYWADLLYAEPLPAAVAQSQEAL